MHAFWRHADLGSGRQRIRMEPEGTVVHGHVRCGRLEWIGLDQTAPYHTPARAFQLLKPVRWIWSGAMTTCRTFAIFALTVGYVLGQQRPAIPAPAGDPFVGEWRLNLHKSRLAADDRILNEVRTYTRDGARVNVLWSQYVDGANPHDGYTVQCDGTANKLSGGRVASCSYASTSIVNGEFHDPRDPKHVYFRHEVSADRRTLTITWFHDAARTKVWTTRIYDRAAE